MSYDEQWRRVQVQCEHERREVVDNFARVVRGFVVERRRASSVTSKVWADDAAPRAYAESSCDAVKRSVRRSCAVQHEYGGACRAIASVSDSVLHVYASVRQVELLRLRGF